MTEDEAKRTWCPFVRVVVDYMSAADHPTTLSGNRNQDGTPATGTLCLASGCQQRRWERAKAGRGQPRAPSPPQPTQGFCGLSGPL